MARIHDDNPDPSGRGDRRAIRRAPAEGDVVPHQSRRGSFGDSDDDGPSQEDLERFGGVTRECPECKQEVYDEAAVCHNCGHAFMKTTAHSPGKQKFWVWATAVVLVVLVAFWSLRGVF